jgi:hypothetical protein
MLDLFNNQKQASGKPGSFRAMRDRWPDSRQTKLALMSTVAYSGLQPRGYKPAAPAK